MSLDQRTMTKQVICRLRQVCFGIVLSSTLTWSQVTVKDLLTPSKRPEDWLLYNGDYLGFRHSGLNEINRDNVAQLGVRWVFQKTTGGKFETTPLVHDGVMYLTLPSNVVVALDASSGVTLWEYRHGLPAVNVGYGRVNRGLGILGDRLFMATADAKLVAIDRISGQMLWESLMADYKQGYSATLAPLVIKDKVLVGVAGGEYGIRGFIDAYRVDDGERVWRFYTVPGPGEFGHDTWTGESWKTGGAPVWLTPSYDAASNTVYWGTGNPAPDLNGDVRLGDNLFSDSVVALDPDTGTRKWHFQFTPHDVHDWDATQVMVLINRELEGVERKLLITANRNGFYYVLDRTTGEFIKGRPFVKQTWAEGLDKHGRPIARPEAEPTPEGTRVYPMIQGGTNWMSPSHSPLTGLFYVTAREGSSLYFKGEAQYEPGQPFWASMWNDEPVDDEWYGAIRALDPLSGRVIWEHRLFRPAWAGLLTTAGGLVFGGTGDGYLKALDADTGEDLWHMRLGGEVRANPISFAVDGRQHISIAAGEAIFVFTLPQ